MQGYFCSILLLLLLYYYYIYYYLLIFIIRLFIDANFFAPSYTPRHDFVMLKCNKRCLISPLTMSTKGAKVKQQRIFPCVQYFMSFYHVPLKMVFIFF